MQADARPRDTGEGTREPLFFGWWIVGGTFVFYFVSGGIFNTATVFFKALATEFDLTRGQLSGVFAVGFLIAGAAAPFWGRIADRRGPRMAFLPGTLLTGAACLALSRVWDLTSLYVLYVLFTFASAGISLVPISVTLSNWFVRKRGRAIGIAYTGVGFGTFLFTAAAGLLIAQIGWRATYVLAGLTVLVLLTPVALWIRNRPQDLGLQPDGEPSPRIPTEGQSVDEGFAPGLGLREAVRTTTFWIVAATWFATLMALTAVNLHQVPFMTDIGLSIETAGLLAGLVGGVSIVGRIGFGLLSERVPARVLYSFCYLLAAAGIGCLWAAATMGNAALTLYIVLYGIAVGGAFAMTALLVADLFGVPALGEIFGVLALPATVGAAIGGVGAGVLFDWTGRYDAVFAFCIALLALGAVSMIVLRAPARR